MAAKPRLLFYFLHLLGVGHVYRAQRLIKGFTAQGFAVDVVYGGKPLPDMSFEAESVSFLPPISAADSTYSQYLDEDGNPLTRAYQDVRTKALLEFFEDLTPDVILTEAYPFGRRMVRHELKAMLDSAQARNPQPLIVSSVRDILQERKKPERLDETATLVERYFDHILVHSDPAIIQLGKTFPLVDLIADKLAYTGFVVPAQNAETKVQIFDVIVSAGGGAFGQSLMETAWELAQTRTDLTWCFATGPNASPALNSRFAETKSPHMKVVSRLENLSAHLEQARLSISQCGYNTAMDVLAAHNNSQCRAIFVAFDTDGQTEQARRADLLARAGYAVNLPQSRLTLAALDSALDQGLALEKVSHTINFDGVASSAKILMDWTLKR